MLTWMIPVSTVHITLNMPLYSGGGGGRGGCVLICLKMLNNFLGFSLRFLQSRILQPLLAAIFLTLAGYLLGAVSPKH